MNRLKNLNIQSVVGDIENNKDDLQLLPMGTITSPKSNAGPNLFSNNPVTHLRDDEEAFLDF